MAKRDICVYNADASPLPQIQVSHSASPEDTYRLPTTTYLANGELTSEVVGGGSPAANASAFTLDTETDYSNSGDRHVVLKNNGTEFGSIYKAPGSTTLVFSGNTTSFSTIAFRPENNSAYDLTFGQLFGAMIFNSNATGGLTFNSKRANSGSGAALIFNAQTALTSPRVVARFQNGGTTELEFLPGGDIAAAGGLGLHGVTPPAQSAAGSTAADAIACLQAHGLMAT